MPVNGFKTWNGMLSDALKLYTLIFERYYIHAMLLLEQRLT